MWNWKIIWKWAIYRNINSLVTSHFGRGFFDGKQMINVSICSWYSLIDLERESECVKSRKQSVSMSESERERRNENDTLFETIFLCYDYEAFTRYPCMSVCFFTSLFVCCIDRLFLSLCSSVLKVLVHLHLCCQSVFYFCFCFRSVTNTHRKFSKGSAVLCLCL